MRGGVELVGIVHSGLLRKLIGTRLTWAASTKAQVLSLHVATGGTPSTVKDVTVVAAFPLPYRDAVFAEDSPRLRSAVLVPLLLGSHEA